MEAMFPYVPVYDPNTTAYSAPYWNPMMAPFPATPTSSQAVMYPDTTVKSGSEGDTPPSGSSSNGQKKERKFRSPQEEQRWRLKRDRNNLAAQKSRQERKRKEGDMQERIRKLEKTCAEQLQVITEQQHRIGLLEQERANLLATYAPFNNENAPPPDSFDNKTFQQTMMFGGMPGQ